MRALLAIGLMASACTSVEDAPCQAIGDESLDVVPAGMGFDEWSSGEALVAAIPPQGGAPYTPLRARVSGLVDPGIGVTVRVSGIDPDDGSEFGQIDYDTRLVCANVGDSAGSWLAADVHFRYFEWELSELDGRQAEITFEVEDGDGNVVSTVLTGDIEAR